MSGGSGLKLRNQFSSRLNFTKIITTEKTEKLVRRRTRSRAEKKKQPPPNKDQRYPDGLDRRGIFASRAQGGDVGSSASQFPSRLFAVNSYPTALRLNIYSKENVIGAVAACLQGSPDMDILLHSQFGKLFQLHVVHCQNSTKLIGSLLCRQLNTIRKFELWFTFGRHPLRFSLDEFHAVTGLNCGSFDVGDSDADEAPGSTMWNKLFDTTLGGITVSQVLEMMWNPFLAGWKRVPLALIALVDGVVCCNDKILKLTPRYVEMLDDIQTFLSYPWGRESFLATLPRFLPPPVSKVIRDPGEAMRVRLSQQTTTCYGFPLALQLFAFEALLQLLCKIPDGARTETFLDDPTACKDIVTILSIQDILAVEADAAVSSFSLDLIRTPGPIPERERYMWLEDVEDDRVTRLVEMMRSGKTFKPEDFQVETCHLPLRQRKRKLVDLCLTTRNLVVGPSTGGIYVHVNLRLLILRTNHHLETADQRDLLKQAGVHTEI
ncbi:hypothetical protein Bca4012_005898 [Brassica carinata]